MTWLQGILQAHPEIAFFLVLGLGYLLGKLSLGGFKLGAVTGTLLAGVIVGQLGVTLPNEVKQCFFLLFLFAIGFRTGPQFFRGLKSDGLAHAALAAIVATTGLVVAYVVAKAFGYDAGTAAGMVAGSLTESAAIGTAMDAIARLDATEAARTAMANNIPVAFAVTYLVGMTGAAWVLSQLAPKLMRDRPRGGMPQARGADAGRRAAEASARREIRIARLRDRPGLAAGSVAAIADLEAIGAARGSSSNSCAGAARSSIASGDAWSSGKATSSPSSGRRTTLVEVLEAPGSGLREVDDRELLDVPGDIVDVVVTSERHRRADARRASRDESVARRLPAHASRGGGTAARQCCRTRRCIAATC